MNHDASALTPRAPAAAPAVSRATPGAGKGWLWQMRQRLTSFWRSPLNRRRWQNFKSNRRGYWSLWIFLGLFGTTLIAEVIANDRPIALRYKGDWLFPVFKDYPESTFGGFLPRTDYRSAFVYDEISKNGWALWPPIRYNGFSSINVDYPSRKGSEGRCLGFPAPPYWASRAELCEAPADQLERYHLAGNRNWLGTDDGGRDVLARIIYGFRISVIFGLLLTIFSSIIGVMAGAVQGYYGGKVDLIFQRFLEIWSSMPSLYVLIIVAAVLAPGFWTLLLVLLCFHWVTLVAVVRAEFLRARNFEYITAARALGLSNTRIMFKHMLPNAMVATLTFIPFKLSGAITALTALDFLGIGLQAGYPSLGELLTQGKDNPSAPWLGLSGFFAVATLLSLLIFIGEAVRDALDPRKTFV